MSSHNRVILLGNLTRDPELKYTPSGTAIAQLGLAVNRRFKQGEEWQEETTFVDVTLFARTAEVANEYLRKGDQCFVEGRLKLDQWDDKTTGQKRSKLTVVGETLQLLGGKPQGASSAPQQGRPPQRQHQRQAPQDDGWR